jgi:alpha-L-fucosidase
MDFRKIILLNVFAIFCVFAYEPTWDSLDSRPLPIWFDEAKVGIFMHWGVYSVPGQTEWLWWNWKGEKNKGAINFMEKNFRPNFTYADFGSMFRAEFFDPDLFAQFIKRSGAKCVPFLAILFYYFNSFCLKNL